MTTNYPEHVYRLHIHSTKHNKEFFEGTYACSAPWICWAWKNWSQLNNRYYQDFGEIEYIRLEQNPDIKFTDKDLGEIIHNKTYNQRDMRALSRKRKRTTS